MKRLSPLVYLGTGVHCQMDAEAVVIADCEVEIRLEPKAYDALVRYVTRMRGTQGKPKALVTYVALLNNLLFLRAEHGELSPDVEETFALALNDCRQGMTEEEEAQVKQIIAERIENP